MAKLASDTHRGPERISRRRRVLDLVAKVESRMEQMRRGNGVLDCLFLGIAFRL
jgi:hypothetical protein